MSDKLHLLLLGVSAQEAEAVTAELQKAGHEIAAESAVDQEHFIRLLQKSPCDVVLADHAPPERSVLPALKIAHTERPRTPVIAITEQLPAEEVAELIHAGITDVVPRTKLSGLGPAVALALQRQRQAALCPSELLRKTGEARFRAVFEGSSLGLAVEDLSGKIIESNRALQQMLGYNAEELQLITRRDFTHARDHKEETEHFRRLLEGNLTFYQAEKRFVRKDGRIIWGKLTVALARDNEGQPQFPIAMIEDITERQRAEEALQQYAGIVDSSNDAIISQTFDGIIFSWNPGAERLYGYTAREANGHPVSIIVPQEKEEELTSLLARLRRGERVDNFETTRLRKDGRVIDVSITTSPIKDAVGRTIGVSSISRDITERKRAEQALRESEENYRRLVELAPDAILIQSEGRYVYINGAGLKLFGATNPEQIIGRPVMEFVHPDYRDAHQELLRQLSQGREVPLREEKFIRLDGSLVDVEATAIPFVYLGQSAFQIVMRDITERKRAEEALRKSQASLARAQQIAHLGSWEHDLKNDHLTWSDETCRIFGIEPGQFEGNLAGFTSRVHPEDRESVRNSVQEAIDKNTVYSVDHRIILPNGEIRTVTEQAEVVRDEKGEPIWLVGTVLDITARKKAEQRIAALSNLGRRLSSARTAKDAAGIIVDVADRLFGWDACNLCLCSPDQKIFNSVLTMDVIDGKRTHVPHLYVDAQPSPLIRRVIENGAELILQSELGGSVASEEKMRSSASAMAVPVRNGPKVIGVLGIQSYLANAYTNDDLQTLQALGDHCGGALERIRAEAENQKLAAFPQFNPNPVLELAADGHLNYFNDAALQMARALGKDHPAEILPAGTAAIVRECLASGKSRLRHEMQVQSRTLAWSFFPVPAIGVVHCYAGDITERQNLEAQLRQSQKMESVGQLAGGIAHDFNNILTVIQGHTSLLSMTADLPEGAADSAQQISHAADRAANLTRQLLTFSRRQIMQPKNLDLNEAVGNMTKMLRRLLGEDITLQVNYAPNLPYVMADPGMIEQVILNLAVNARDAMPRGGRLFVDTSTANIDEAQARNTPGANPGEYVCLTVKDTGVGIAPEHLARIFEPFFTTKDVGKGTGLGLATVYGIVQQHRGWITVSSKVNVETMFQIFLPATAAKSEIVELAAPERDVRGGSETILVVEDEGPLRALVKSLLQRYGYTVLDADSGVNALSVWRSNKDQIHLLLTDMVMPHGMSGRELADRLARDKPDLKIIYSSGYSLAVVGSDMVLQEGLNFLQKPYHPRKLAQAVRDCLDSKD